MGSSKRADKVCQGSVVERRRHFRGPEDRDVEEHGPSEENRRLARRSSY